VRIVVVNVGSATAKLAVFDVAPDAEREVARWSREISASTSHADAVESILAQIGTQHIDAVGHRVVHGGADLTEPTLIDDAVEAAIDDLSRLAPQHNPPALDGIRAARARLPHRA
jgi:acetate kinase